MNKEKFVSCLISLFILIILIVLINSFANNKIRTVNIEGNIHYNQANIKTLNNNYKELSQEVYNNGLEIHKMKVRLYYIDKDNKK